MSYSKASSRSLVFAMLSLLLAGCTVGGMDVEQEQASGLAGELLGGRSFGQTFTLQYDGLYRVDLYTATYARENTQPVIFRVRATADSAEDLVRLELPAAQISNSGPTAITFPPLADTAGRKLYFSVESPGSVPGDAVTIYRHEEDVYPGGEMYVDGQAAGGDMAFIAYTRETFTLSDIWNDFYSRASQDRSFFTFYCVLLALLLVALAATLVWPRYGHSGDAGPDPGGAGQGPEEVPTVAAEPGSEVDE
jgi:hypothetical protein